MGEKMRFVHPDDVLSQSAKPTVQLSTYTPTSAAVYMCTSRREANAERLWKWRERNTAEQLPPTEGKKIKGM